MERRRKDNEGATVAEIGEIEDLIPSLVQSMMRKQNERERELEMKITVTPLLEIEDLNRICVLFMPSFVFSFFMMMIDGGC